MKKNLILLGSLAMALNGCSFLFGEKNNQQQQLEQQQLEQQQLEQQQLEQQQEEDEEEDEVTKSARQEIEQVEKKREEAFKKCYKKMTANDKKIAKNNYNKFVALEKRLTQKTDSIENDSFDLAMSKLEEMKEDLESNYMAISANYKKMRSECGKNYYLENLKNYYLDKQMLLNDLVNDTMDKNTD